MREQSIGERVLLATMALVRLYFSIIPLPHALDEYAIASFE